MNYKNVLGDEKWSEFGGESPLIAAFRSLHPIGDEIVGIINEQTFPVYFTKGKHLASPHKRNRYAFFILTGSVHGYLISRNKKITNSIAIEGDFVGSIRNLFREVASEEFLESIEPVLAIAIPHKMSKYLYDNYPSANYIGREIVEIQLKKSFENAIIARLPTGRERYEKFVANYNHLFNRIPLKYIASFLAMRLETLCRIRAIVSKLDQHHTTVHTIETK